MSEDVVYDFIKGEIKTSHEQCSQSQDDLESTLLHGTVLILVINEAELVPPVWLICVCTSLCQAPRGPERARTHKHTPTPVM